MPIFVDSDVFIAAFNKRDGAHERGNALLMKALKGGYGKIYTSDFVLDEVISRLLKETEKERIHRAELVSSIESSIQESTHLQFEHIDEFVVSTAKLCFKKYTDKYLSLTDWTSVVFMGENKIDKILSFDHHFDTIKGIPEFPSVERVC